MTEKALNANVKVHIRTLENCHERRVMQCWIQFIFVTWARGLNYGNMTLRDVDPPGTHANRPSLMPTAHHSCQLSIGHGVCPSLLPTAHHSCQPPITYANRPSVMPTAHHSMATAHHSCQLSIAYDNRPSLMPTTHHSCPPLIIHTNLPFLMPIAHHSYQPPIAHINRQSLMLTVMHLLNDRFNELFLLTQQPI